MIKWIDAIKNPPTRSGEYLVWFGKRTDDDPENCTLVVQYSARHREWNSYDDLPACENRFTNVTHYAVLNNPAESDACDEYDDDMVLCDISDRVCSNCDKLDSCGFGHQERPLCPKVQDEYLRTKDEESEE